MSRSRSKNVKELEPNYKVRLDSKTIITIRDMAKFQFWKERFPNAVIIS